MNYDLLEPLKYYESTGKKLHEDNTAKYFDDLLEKSQINVEENRLTVKKYNEECNIIKGLDKVLRKFRILKGLLIAAIVIGAILAILSFTQFPDYVERGIILIVIGAIMIVASVLIIKKLINPKIKDTSAVRDRHLARANELLAEAKAQVAPLNALFDDTDTFKIIEETIPDFKFDSRFTKTNESLFCKKHDFRDFQTAECSMLNTISGSFAGNPFVFGRRRIHTMGTMMYTGSLTIHWTETYRDSNGNIKSRTRSETLHASVVKPKPNFHVNTYLAYGSQAAPDLTFSRETKHTEDLSDGAIERKIRRGEKKLERKARKALKNGESFQEMANTEFDVLFGATDRDHELQFRLMYTPLAQKSIIALLKDKNNYGDDFDFLKEKRFNAVISDHAQNWNMNTSGINYYSHDVDEIRSKFLDFNREFFRSVFFDFAPLFAVPAYMEEPSVSLDGMEDYPTNFTYYEHEVMANAIGYDRFVHEDSRTEAILKTNLSYKNGNCDIVSVTAYSYTTVPRIDYIPVKGGDGRYHPVPVPWVEYIPVEKTSSIEVKNLDLSEKEYRDNFGTPSENSAYLHGLSATKIN